MPRASLVTALTLACNERAANHDSTDYGNQGNLS
jgi:hypothetical protein